MNLPLQVMLKTIDWWLAMPRRSRELSESGYYHVVLRGAGKMIIFEERGDYQAFLSLLVNRAVERNVAIIAYCLMSNHVHLVLRDDGRNLSDFMHSLATAYAKRFNERNCHVGPVFQGRFYSVPLESDEHLLEAVRYVHQNPYKARISTIDGYEWSSYREYIRRAKIVETSTVKGMFNSIKAFSRFMRTPGSSYRLPAIEKVSLTDQDAAQLMRDSLTREEIKALSGDSRMMRNSALRKLRDVGIGISQAARLTGIGRNIVSKAFAESQ